MKCETNVNEHVKEHFKKHVYQHCMSISRYYTRKSTQQKKSIFFWNFSLLISLNNWFHRYRFVRIYTRSRNKKNHTQRDTQNHNIHHDQQNIKRRRNYKWYIQENNHNYNVTFSSHFQCLFEKKLLFETLSRLNNYYFEKVKKNYYFTIVSYRSIALLNIMSKIMKFIVVKRINYLIETYNLLSITHMKVKKTMSIEHALHYIIEKVQTTWNENMMISIMLLNIIKVFNFMSHSRWLHNFKIKQIDKRLIRWIEYFLNEKITRLKINEHITNKINIKVEKL